MIASRHNPLLKTARALLRRPGRQRHGLFLVEGRRAVSTVLEAGATVEAILLDAAAEAPRGAEHVRLERLAEGLLETVTDAVSPDGVVALVRVPVASFATVGALERVVILDQLRDPGNLGTILRTADAVGAGVLLSPGCADPLAPKVVRASVGAVVRVPWCQSEDKTLGQYLAADEKHVVVLDAHAGDDLLQADLPYPLRLIAGGEASGARPGWPGRKLRLPMRSGCESLNVGIATAVALYESVRQQGVPRS